MKNKNAIEQIVDLHFFMEEARVELTQQPDNPLRWIAYSLIYDVGAFGTSPGRALLALQQKYLKQKSDMNNERARDAIEGLWEEIGQ